MLQVRGVQEATTLTPPGARAVTTPVELIVALAGVRDVQVMGEFVNSCPRRSTTVAVRVAVPALAIENEVLVEAFPTCNWMDCTWQVSNQGCGFPLLSGIATGRLLTPERLAKTCVIPGAAAVTRAWVICWPLLFCNSASLNVSFATVLLVCWNVNEPTVLVMSTPLLIAWAFWSRKFCAA